MPWLWLSHGLDKRRSSTFKVCSNSTKKWPNFKLRSIYYRIDSHNRRSCWNTNFWLCSEQNRPKEIDFPHGISTNLRLDSDVLRTKRLDVDSIQISRRNSRWRSLNGHFRLHHGNIRRSVSERLLSMTLNNEIFEVFADS